MANAEICFLGQSCDDFNIDDLLTINTSLVMSFLEDSQVEEGDDEVLRAMVESHEPEITSQDSCSETYQFSEEVVQLECCSSMSHHQDFEWIDMEMDYSCPSHEITGYFISRNMVELGGLEDYSQLCDGMPMEEDGYIGLWQ
ncbi:hypothetical protein AAHA92_27135 [Salvia divinorum]|uniref:Uncharacterized protein n=1 Tax=Salvia divinorum TaxID=28513 RepID=A0ABD1G2Q2_SALDI